MTRLLTALAVLFFLTTSARAQDMPLSQILIDGEGWRKVEGKPEKPKDGLEVRISGITGVKETMTARFGGREVTIAESGNIIDAAPEAIALSKDGATAFLGYQSREAVWAFRIGKDNKMSDGAPYCPLRLSRGQLYTGALALALDSDGRIYAATEIGVQVFDPTGRLCGVLTPAAPGRPYSLVFQGDQLTMWIDETKYTRKLNATGRK